jgi:long-subunit fatty acid transport protein
MNSNHYLLGLLFVFSMSLSHAQWVGTGVYSPFASPNNPNQKFKIGLEAGSNFSSFGNGVSLLSNSITPRISWQTNDSFVLEAGISFSSFHSRSIPFQSLTGLQSGNPFMGISGYASGRYMASERLMISGTVFRHSSMNQGLSINPGAFQFLNQGASFGFDYKLSEKFSFGAGFQINHISGPGFYNRDSQIW